jgi:hypothetical protein
VLGLGFGLGLGLGLELGCEGSQNRGPSKRTKAMYCIACILVLSCLVLSCLVLSCLVLSGLVLALSCLVLYLGANGSPSSDFRHANISHERKEGKGRVKTQGSENRTRTKMNKSKRKKGKETFVLLSGAAHRHRTIASHGGEKERRGKM